ncbi:hypothetical protein [Streptomyces fradiae]|uniref:hypothetical protein n=2 Tax=Streptomyces TaxID=1883 RepID=UPI00378946B5
MALTYKKVMETDFGKLTTAAKAWDDMAGEFKKAESAYSAAVRGVKVDSGWHGIAAGRAHVNFAGTQYEYGAAQTQAKAIASLLRDAHGQFTELKRALETVVADARKDKMKVDADGNVQPDLTDSERRAYVHDPDGQKLLGDYARAARSWADQIQKYVTAFEDADSGVKLALEKAVKDSNKDLLTGKDDTTNGFNAGAKSDIEQYELEYAKDVTTRINNGEKVSDAEVQGLSRILRDNNNEAFKHRTEFGQTFLSSIGADGTIKLANTLNNVAHSGDSGRSGLYRDTNTALANTVSAATQVVFEEGKKNPPYGSKEYREAFAKWSKTEDAKFYNSFMSDLKKAGVAEYDLDVAGDKIAIGRGHDQEIRGYQGLVTLMQQGKGYSPQFLGDLTDQMIAAEKSDKDIWDLYGKFHGKEDGWFANDPVDGALKIMGRNPEAATGYLDPAADGDQDRLKYFLKDRDWDVVNTTEWRGNYDVTGKDTFDADIRAGLGLALEAATTGHAAGGPGTELGRHSEAQARIMHDTINLLDYGHAAGKEGDHDRVGKAAEVLKEPGYANLKDPLARAFASYTPDVVDILAGEGPGGRTGEAGAHANGSDGSQIQNSRSSLLRFMRGVTDVPGGSHESPNFDLIYQAQQGYLAEQLVNGDYPNSTALEVRAQRIGEVMGSITAVGGDLDLGERDAKNSTAGDTRFYGYHIGGGAITGIPIIGDIAQRSVDIGLNQWLSAVQAENGLLARERLSSQNDAAHDGIDTFFQSWNDQTKSVDADTLKLAQNEARSGYTDGRGIAFEALREKK